MLELHCPAGLWRKYTLLEIHLTVLFLHYWDPYKSSILWTSSKISWVVRFQTIVLYWSSVCLAISGNTELCGKCLKYCQNVHMAGSWFEWTYGGTSTEWDYDLIVFCHNTINHLLKFPMEMTIVNLQNFQNPEASSSFLDFFFLRKTNRFHIFFLTNTNTSTNCVN